MKRVRPAVGRDRGTSLVMIMVLIVIAGLVVAPLLTYASTVLRAQRVPVNKNRAINDARAAIWVALAAQEQLYTDCVSPSGVGPVSVVLPPGLENATAECEILEDKTLREPEAVPYSLATTQALTRSGNAAQVPPSLAATIDFYSDKILPRAAAIYNNPNSSAATAEASYEWWLLERQRTNYLDPRGGDSYGTMSGPDYRAFAAREQVWLPQLPVPYTSSSLYRDIDLPPGSFDPAYSACRVMFPGTFNTEVVLDGPTYFTSGVYYFTEPVTITDGADVVVGVGEAAGCTFDGEAVANATDVPNPMNITGVGGTFILGKNARLIVDDQPSNPAAIRFVINQRYVDDAEISVAASSGVSILSVNGDHPIGDADPTYDTDPTRDHTLRVQIPDLTQPDPALWDGVIAVPPSRVDDPADDESIPGFELDDELAITAGYETSRLSPKFIPPAPPPAVTATGHPVADAAAGQRAVKIVWQPPAELYGSPVIEYKATLNSGETCGTKASGYGAPIITECVIGGVEVAGSTTAVVQARTAGGWSLASAPVAVAATVDAVLTAPPAPTTVEIVGEFAATETPAAESPAGALTVGVGANVTATVAPVSRYEIVANQYEIYYPLLDPANAAVLQSLAVAAGAAGLTGVTSGIDFSDGIDLTEVANRQAALDVISTLDPPAEYLPQWRLIANTGATCTITGEQIQLQADVGESPNCTFDPLPATRKNQPDSTLWVSDESFYGFAAQAFSGYTTGTGSVVELASPVTEYDGRAAGQPVNTATAMSPVRYEFVPGSTKPPAPLSPALVAPIRIPDPIIDLSLNNSTVNINVAGYVAVPQGLIEVNATSAANKRVTFDGGVVAAEIFLPDVDTTPIPTCDPTDEITNESSCLRMVFDNPIAQRRLRIRSSATVGAVTVHSEAIVQVNRSGSVGINSWLTQ